MQSVHPSKVKTEKDGNESACCADDAGELVEGEVTDDFDFGTGLDCAAG